MRPSLVIAIAYLLGSIPFGYLIVKVTEGDDVRQTGSGGTGATNVSRRAGKTAGVLTLALDALKGAAAVAFARMVFGSPVFGAHISIPLIFENAEWWVAAAAITVIVGHIFPIWLRFRGGKGVATGVGVFLMLAPVAVGLAGLIFLLVVWRTRYISLGSMLAALTIPLFVFLLDAFIRPLDSLLPTFSAGITGAVLIVFAHRENIGRLMKGTESRFR